MTQIAELPAVTEETAKELGLLPEEFQKINTILGRSPNFVELSVFSVMWSEHCSYKNSIKWLKTLPKEGPHMLVEAGEENAGLVDIGNGLACCFKIESHNHPSALEPYQGAATGVGGINRDIFTMGARPIAQLNSLRFGKLDSKRTQHLLKGVVKGIGDYGNSFGVPVVGGEVYFEDCYFVNILVNAMSAGIVETGKTISAISYGKGNPVFIVGADTGKDGIHGATFASGELSEDSANDLPSVQVGDPFQEKLLLEATLELAETDAIIGMQDMGAAGIICSTSEMSAKGKSGMVINLDKVPVRQTNMLPWEILLSESQERMLVVVKKGREEEVNKIFDKWDIHCEQIGEVIDEDKLYFHMHGEQVAVVPADALVLGGGAPIYEREYTEPTYIAKSKAFDLNTIDVPEDLDKIAIKLLSHHNIASKKWVSEQYDSMVGTKNMNTNKPSDAAVVNIKDSEKAIVLTVDCNARYVYADPEKGASIAVAEAARNITCSGGTPSAITNCLNFGNPYNPEVYWQFVHVIKGMGEACKKFKTPVTGGNVSFYNQSMIDGKEVPVYPTPTIGMLGIMEDKKHLMTLDFKQADDIIYLIGNSRNDINSSEYLHSIQGVQHSPAPYLDLDEELNVQSCIRNLIKSNLIQSAHDVSDGGLFIALAESAMHNEFGFDVTSDKITRADAFWFGESQSRVVVSVTKANEDSFIDSLKNNNCNYHRLGKVSTEFNWKFDNFEINDAANAKNTYLSSIESYL